MEYVFAVFNNKYKINDCTIENSDDLNDPYLPRYAWRTADKLIEYSFCTFYISWYEYDQYDCMSVQFDTA